MHKGEREVGGEIFQGIIAKNFPDLLSKQITESKPISRKINQRTTFLIKITL